MINSTSLKFADQPQALEESLATSDYASLETVNRLSSASNYSVKTNTPQEENLRNRNRENQEGPFGFCNPNYMGPDIKSILTDENLEEKQFVQLINTPDSAVDDSTDQTKSEDEDILELQNFNGVINKNTKVYYRQCSRNMKPPKSLELNNCREKSRASSASRVEKNVAKNTGDSESKIDPFVPLYMFIVGGKEQGQVTVFQRPLSIWRLKLY